MKKIITLLTTLLLMGWSVNAWSFTCKTAAGASIPVGGGSANVYVTLVPMVNVGQNLVVDLSTQISCINNSAGGFITDYVSLAQGSAYGGALSSFTGTVKYNGRTYPFPLTTETAVKNYNDSQNYVPWPAALYLTPISTAGGVAITAGSLIAILKLHQTNNYNADSYYFTWNIYANNDVVVPTGGCDVSSRDVTVTLPDYPGSTAIPLTVHCAQNQTLGYYLSGTTADTANSIFTNTASSSQAQGIGVQLTRNGSALPTNSTVSLGTVGTSAVNLGLTATYARTSGQVTAGNVQSIIGVTFVYQ
jgi:minor fimbrial subunit